MYVNVKDYLKPDNSENKVLVWQILKLNIS